MSAISFAEILRRRVAEEVRDTGVTKEQLARRLCVSASAVEVWIAGGRPKPRYFAVLARFVRVSVAQMEEWFPEAERRASYSRRAS